MSGAPQPLASGGSGGLPPDFTPRRLARRLAEVVGLLGVLVLVAALAPGLGHVRQRLDEAAPGWLALAAVFEALSCAAYIPLFRQVFCPRMSWRTSTEIGLAELAAGSIVPASGAGGLALGAWILNRGGMPADRIARRSVAFFLIKSSVNWVAVVLLGALMALGIVGPPISLLLTAVPAALAAIGMALVVAIPRLGTGERAEGGSRAQRAFAAVRRALVGGVAEAVTIVRARNPTLLAAALGYWLFDNAVLWATYKAVGTTVPVSIVLMGYLIGQLGGALPLPGGVGGIDGGLIGTLVVYGAPAAPTVAAVLAYRIILFWLPLLAGGVAFVFLRRTLNRAERWDVCEPVRVA